MDLFTELAIIIGIAAGVSLVMLLLKQPLILGHILTGIIAGPMVMNVVKSNETISVFSHLGIASLLFIIGLSLRPSVLRDVGKISLFAGLGQVIFTALLGFLVGAGFGFPWAVNAYLAVAFTLSSTIIATKLLHDKHDVNALYGKIVLGMLLVQDVVAMVAVIVVTGLATGGGTSDAFIALGLKTVVLASSLILVSLYVLPALTPVFARSQEFLFLFAVAWGIGTAAVFRAFGLSIELGALSAGIALAASPYVFEIAAKMRLLRDFFIVMFFVLLGSQLTFGGISSAFGPILAYSAFVLIGNPLVIMAVMGAMGYGKRTGFLAGLSMAQVSEFSLVLVLLGVQVGHIPASVLPIVMAVGIITIAISTAAALRADTLYRFFAPALGIFERRKTKTETKEEESYDAVLIGCHRVGNDFLPSIQKLRMPYLVVDFDPHVLAELTHRGIHARYGDASDNEFLEAIGIAKAKVVVSTTPEFETNEFLVNKIRKTNAKSTIVVTAERIEDAERLYADGASYVVMPHHVGGNYAAQLLARYGADGRKYAQERARHLEHIRERHRVTHPLEHTERRESGIVRHLSV
jgi:Kef-type K+ transport system membrane component KefB/Trk K+ transport system NAD-binding subunit